jgi:predicted acyl esterase
MVEPNGKTVKENNLELKHNIPLGSLVEVKSDNWYGDGACEIWKARLWVLDHSRDCDGTPLYILGRDKNYDMCKHYHSTRGGFSEGDLKVIEVTQKIKDGYDSLEWGINET